MRRHISPPNSFFTILWALFHSAIILAFLISLLHGGGIHMDSDLSGMIPDTAAGVSDTLHHADTLHVADTLLTRNASRNIFILVSHAEFGKAKDMAGRVYEALAAHPWQFESLTLAADMGAASDIEGFIYANRYRLLPAAEADRILASEEGADSFAGNALVTAFSGFSLASMDLLDGDPFLLTDTELRSCMEAVQDSGTALSPRDGVLATEYEGKSYVMIRAVLSEEGARLASRRNAVSTVYDVCLPLESDGFRFVFSGTPFHSYESSLSASREITLISAVSLFLVLCLLVLVFRSPLPIVMSLLSVALSAASAFACTHAVFGDIKALALVFGTSLIGCCIDYSLHFFMHWKYDAAISSGGEVRSLLFRGLGFSFISTQLCYVLLFFMPFPLLRQIALFSFTGITSSFLTTVGLYPLFRLPKRRARLPLMKFPSLARGRLPWGKLVPLAMMAASICVLAVRHDSLKVRNGIGGLYKMQGRLKEDTILSAMILRYNPGSYFIVSGNTAEEVLLREEALCARLRDRFVATSRFIPSRRTQDKSFAACGKLLLRLPGQLDMLWQDDGGKDGILSEFEKEKVVYLEPDSLGVRGSVPESLASIMKLLWLGDAGDGTFCSVVLPASVSDAALYQDLADETEGVYYLDKVSGINGSLDWLTRKVLLMFAAAYLLIIAVMKLNYSWRQTLMIAAVPLVSISVILAVFAASGYSVDFFCTAGMVLVFGLGLDYIIYMTEHGRRDETGGRGIEPAAVLLSFVTTELSFGALALSSFVPVHIIGLCIFAGCLAAFLCTGMGRENCKDS